MAKRPTKVDKKEFNFDDFIKKNNLNQSVNTKPLTWIPLSKPWHDALKIPGFPRGYMSTVRGFSNTGKSTAFYEAIAGAQSIGDLPIVIETEGNWNDDHARQCGVKYKEVVDKETGEITYKPTFVLMKPEDFVTEYACYDYSDSKMKSKPLRKIPVIEDVIAFMNDTLDKQDNGDLNANLCFLWDSVGSLDCFKSVQSLVSNNQWNAGAMTKFQSILNYRIPSSRLEKSEFTNTFITVQKIWIDNMNGGGIKHRGGEALFYNTRLIIHLGGQVAHGTTKLHAEALSQKFQYGIKTKIKCEKNHITGIERSGDICSTPHGFVNPDELSKYKSDYKDYIHKALSVDFDTEINFSSEEDGKEVKDK